MYEITNYTKQKARELGVKIKPSSNKTKKIDVFNKDYKKITSIGAVGYLDYPNYLKQDGKEIANERRRLYNIRHKNDKGVAGKWAKALLW